MNGSLTMSVSETATQVSPYSLFAIWGHLQKENQENKNEKDSNIYDSIFYAGLIGQKTSTEA